MRILYLTPSLNTHGGIRVLIEHCNGLANYGHNVTLQSFGGYQELHWAKLSDKVKLIFSNQITDIYDVVVAGSPPLANLLERANISAKKFFLLQMAEHLFVPNNLKFKAECLQSYNVSYPIIGISRWVEYVLKHEFRRLGKTYYIGNGVSEDFKPTQKINISTKKTVLVEGWESYNAAKDVSGESHKVAKRLKDDGYTIIAFSQFPLKTNPQIPNRYVQTPTQEQLISLYQEATILLKASRLDARSCAPVEAMACNTVTVRSILHGDDDLIHLHNAMVSNYGDTEAYYQNAKLILEDYPLRQKLIENGKEYRKTYLDWAKWVNVLEQIFNQ